jgi:cellulose synthase/poly-beta-1,6-N-acetylglucosamine synthase-like glycosyltransferase
MTLPAPDPALRMCVVVPARNEEEFVGSCLRALAEQEGVSCEEYEILLVLDECTDGTEARAREVAASSLLSGFTSWTAPEKDPVTPDAWGWRPLATGCALLVGHTP